MSQQTTHSAPPATFRPFRLILTLGIAGFLSGLVLVSVYLFTLPMIESNQSAALEKAIYEVLPEAKRYKHFTKEGSTLRELELGLTGTVEEDVPQIYGGYNVSGDLVGFAIPTEEPGYQDLIKGIFGYDPHTRKIVGMVVLESKETPGLGDKILKDEAFQQNFQELAIDPSIVAVKKGEKQGTNEVEAITGATISSKAVARMLQKGATEWAAAIDQWTQTREE
jgi:electron transport complex protein RnfG